MQGIHTGKKHKLRDRVFMHQESLESNNTTLFKYVNISDTGWVSQSGI